jgi:hypothetical protein
MNRLKKISGKQSYITIASKIAINKFNEVKDLYSENYKSLRKEIEDIRRWKDLLWTGRISMVKMAYSTEKKSLCSMQSLSKFQ